MNASYNLSAIRQLLNAAFSVSELQTLAFDLFRPVYDDLPTAATKSFIIQQIITYAERNGRIPHLLQAVEERNRYQYGRFANQLQTAVSPIAHASYGYEQRLADLKQHINRESALLRDYEELRDNTRDPRDRRRYQTEIDRQNSLLADYRQQLAALASEIQHTQQAAPDPQPSLTDVLEAIHTLQQQMKQAEDNLTAGQEQIRAHIDERHRDTVTRIIAQLDAQHQAEILLLQEAAAQQQIARWDAQQMTLLVQQALLDLARLRQNQPDAAYWGNLLDAVNEYATWEQKLKFTLPIIPGIIEFESEMNVDVIPKLQEMWHALVAQFRR
ncbi:MAG: hypothetical protein KC443_15520 [Anaerolineales bacterium]|nr:hypothetical protein [Anaerolineales bacterium]